MVTKLKYPSIVDIANVIKALKNHICDDYIYEGDDLPSIQITIGYSLDGSWSYQSGDNSYTGGLTSIHFGRLIVFIVDLIPDSLLRI